MFLRGLKRFIRGKQGPEILHESSRTITAQNLYVKSPVTVEQSISYSNAGVFTTPYTGTSQVNSPAIAAGEWLSSGSASNWEIRVTKTAGSNNTSGSALATWLALSTTRTWTWSYTGGPGSITATVTVDFRRSGGGSPEFTYTGIVITAQVI